MIEEIRDGLIDATAAQSTQGGPHERAAQRAVRQFGTVGELIPSCQLELTIAQTRRTAQALALTTTLLIVYWHLIWITNDAHAWGLPRIVQLLGVHLAVLAAIAALLATSTLAATGPLARWLPVPRRLPLLVAWTGTITSTAMAITTLALATAAAFTANRPLIAFGGALTASSHAVLAASARACRHCAETPALERI
jgi:hypothetical protein